MFILFVFSNECSLIHGAVLNLKFGRSGPGPGPINKALTQCRRTDNAKGHGSRGCPAGSTGRRSDCLQASNTRPGYKRRKRVAEIAGLRAYHFWNVQRSMELFIDLSLLRVMVSRRTGAYVNSHWHRPQGSRAHGDFSPRSLPPSHPRLRGWHHGYRHRSRGDYPRKKFKGQNFPKFFSKKKFPFSKPNVFFEFFLKIRSKIS